MAVHSIGICCWSQRPANQKNQVKVHPGTETGNTEHTIIKWTRASVLAQMPTSVGTYIARAKVFILVVTCIVQVSVFLLVATCLVLAIVFVFLVTCTFRVAVLMSLWTRIMHIIVFAFTFTVC